MVKVIILLLCCFIDAFAYIKAAAQYPQLMKYLPTLLPRQFKELLGVDKKRKKDPQQQTPQASNEPEEELGDSRLLAKLEEIISSDIWKLGFKYVSAEAGKLNNQSINQSVKHTNKLFISKILERSVWLCIVPFIQNCNH